ncbi:hypothetical protein JCM11251_005649 [Rhodosporidiobolus azoricus]
MSFTYLITGASRSLGLGFATELLAQRPDARIIAAARNPEKADGLQKLIQQYGKDKLYLLKMDVEDKASVESAAKELESSGFLENGGLDALINNAGVARHHELKPSQITADSVLANLGPNFFGVINVNSGFLPLLRKGKGKEIYALSSLTGSIGQWGVNAQTTSYSISKVSLNMYLSKLAAELKDEGFKVTMFHPGYVATDMNSYGGDISIKEATESSTKNVFLSSHPSPSFINYKGETLLW